MIRRSILLIQIAFRNLFSSFLNVIIGGIILVGTMLVVIGSSLLDSMDRAMSRSIIGSVAGNIQIFSSKSKDDLALFGNFGGEAELAPVLNFSRVKSVLERIPNVKTVVPMGINSALVTSGNTIDVALAKLREAIKQRSSGDRSARLASTIQSKKELVRQMARVLIADLHNIETISTESGAEPENIQALNRASSDIFWDHFEQDPLDALEFLENRIAPLATDADLIYLRYIGTDLDHFQLSFDRMEITEGSPVPKGQRGFLFSKFFYEDQLKLKTARRLDKIQEALDVAGKKIAKDAELQRWVKENQSQVQEIVLQLDSIRTQQAIEALQQELHSTDPRLPDLLQVFFKTDDDNFHGRLNFFYQKIAPMLELYRIRIGDLLTIKAFTRSGYVQSVNVKVYGAFSFKGLEKSSLAGNLNLIDLMSFRDLYGYMSSDRIDEIKKMQSLMNVSTIDRGNAESQLFGTTAEVVTQSEPGLLEEPKTFTSDSWKLRKEDLVKRVYSQSEIEGGVVLNAAVILHDSSRIKDTLRQVNQAVEQNQLKLKAVSWQEASGLIGQFVRFAKWVLYFAVFIVFVVALIIINNAMMMATLQRIREIGTLRAIGAQRAFVLGMVLIETLVLGFGFGAVGAMLGSLVVKVLGSVGIPAPNEALYFFFSGPRLYPTLEFKNLVLAFGIVLTVSLISTLYPALMATRVSPLQAMQTDE